MSNVIHSMGVSVDGFVTDRDGDFNWPGLTDELFAEHLARVRGTGVHLLGRRLYETMLVWENDPAIRSDPLREEFADVWTALPKVVFSRTRDTVQGAARLATGSLAEEIAAAREAADGRDVGIGGAELAGQAFELGLVDELRIFRFPVVVGSGKPFLPPVASPVPMELAEVRRFAPRVIYERYTRSAEEVA